MSPAGRGDSQSCPSPCHVTGLRFGSGLLPGRVGTVPAPVWDAEGQAQALTPAVPITQISVINRRPCTAHSAPSSFQTTSPCSVFSAAESGERSLESDVRRKTASTISTVHQACLSTPQPLSSTSDTPCPTQGHPALSIRGADPRVLWGEVFRCQKSFLCIF